MSELQSLMGSLFFQDMEKESAALCAESFRRRKYAEGERIAEEGEDCKCLIFIASGEAAVQKYTSDGEFTTVELLQKGDFFGEEVFEKGEARYRFTLEALSDVDILSIPGEILLKDLQRFPKLKENFIRILLNKEQSRGQRIVLLSQKSVRQKLACFLLGLQKKQGGGEMVILPGSREVISKLLALPRPSFSRELKSMEQASLIEVEGRKIRIREQILLEKLVEER